MLRCLRALSLWKTTPRFSIHVLDTDWLSRIRSLSFHLPARPSAAGCREASSMPAGVRRDGTPCRRGQWVKPVSSVRGESKIDVGFRTRPFPDPATQVFATSGRALSEPMQGPALVIFLGRSSSRRSSSSSSSGSGSGSSSRFSCSQRLRRSADSPCRGKRAVPLLSWNARRPRLLSSTVAVGGSRPATSAVGPGHYRCQWPPAGSD
jgi:hypothetical protein